MRPLILSTLLSFTTLTACIDEGFPDDHVEDTEIGDDSKTDGWWIETPQGTFSIEGAAPGELVKLTLNANKTFRREISRNCNGCAPTVEQGKFKFTQGGGSRYIRFLKPNGSLLDRYGFEVHGRQLQVRKLGETEWQSLMAEDNFGAVQSVYAGTYTAYGRGQLPKGSIFDLKLHDTGRFYMGVEAVHACNAPGHTCGSTWSDGFTGSTYIYGTWAERDGGVTLTPRNDTTGAEGWKFDLNMTITGATVELTGKDGSLDLVGSMDVRARFSGAHSVQPSGLTGTWKVDKVGDGADFTASLWGTALVFNGATHRVTFDATTNEICELSPNVNNDPKCGIYQIAGDPSGDARGVVYGYRGTEFTALTITSKSATSVKLRSDEDTLFTLTRE